MSFWPRTTAARPPTPNGSTSGPNRGSSSSASVPSPPGAGDALAPLERRGIPLLRTWRQGAIRLHVDGRWNRHAFFSATAETDRRGAPPTRACGQPPKSSPSSIDAADARSRLPHAALDRLHGIRAGSDRLSRPGGHRVRGLGADRSPSIDRFRRISGRGRRQRPSRNVPASRSRFEHPTAPGWPAVGCPPRGRSSRDGPRSCFTGSPKPRRRSRHDAPPP